MSEKILQSHRATWASKPVLRLLYTDWYERMSEHLCAGATLEIGGGSGNLSEYAANVVCTDITSVPWLDAVADAQNLPFVENSFSNIVGFDVVHHLENPVMFFKEAIRVLKPGGRIVLMEPYISWASWPVYHFLHTEPVNMRDDPFVLKAHDPKRNPFDANQAIPTLMFGKMRYVFEMKFPELEMRFKQFTSLIVYPLSGGFDHPSLISMTCAKLLLRFEKLLKPLSRWLAFRMLVVLEVKPCSR